MNKLQTTWQMLSLLILVLASYLFIVFKPSFVFSFSDFILGILAGSFTYYFGKLLQARKNKQLVSIRGIFINSVVISPLAEEIIFRFGIIVVLFNSSTLGILTSAATWIIIHLVYEIVSGTPFKYYRTSLGLLDSLVSGIVLSVIYVYSGFNLFVPWIAHALHNLLIWISIAYPAKGASVLQWKGTMHKIVISSSGSFVIHNKHFSKSIFKVVATLLFVLFSSVALATHNPSVSHSATNIVNGTFSDNYTFLSYAQNATPIVIRANDTQLANLTVWQTFAGVPLASINATGSWRLGSAGTPVLFIDNNTGSVGIGTTTPGATLHVASNLSVNANITGAIIIANGSLLTDVRNSSIQALDTVKLLNIAFLNSAILLAYSNLTGSIAALERGNFTSGLNAQLSLANQTVNITIVDTANETYTNVLQLSHRVSQGSNGTAGIGTGILLHAVDAANQTEQIGLILANLTTATNQSEASALSFFTRTGGGALTERMRITPSGDVGIGTAAPNQKLVVTGIVNFTAATILGNVSYTWPSADGSASQVLSTNAAGVLSWIAQTGVGGGPWSNTTTVIFNNTAGVNVGIGTAAPQARLQVNGTTPALQVNDSAYLAVSGGRVGINTTNPTQALHVAGSVNVTGTIYFGVNLTGYGADYAEMFEKLHPSEDIGAGDIVAIVSGKATKPRAGASLYMVVTDSAALIGNSGKGGVPVAFVGQVRAKVSGKVQEGDYILAGSSAGYAKSKGDVSFDEFKSKVVGIALEGKDSEGIARITVAVGVK